MVKISRLALLARMFVVRIKEQKKQILVMEIHRGRKDGKLWLSQLQYKENILKKFGMNNVKPENIPLAFHLFSSGVYPCNMEEKVMFHVLYAS
jgi:hypothetical protein